jgi:hypothetical protein
MKTIKTVKALEEFGRIRLSKSFFMRDFLHSEISQIEGIPNIPEDPGLAIKAGTNLCEKVLEPIQEALGRISIRSAYRSSAVNAKGAENKNQYNCAKNESNYAHHIWDIRDKNGFMGATACIIVNSFISYYENTDKDWLALAWWIHDNIPEYSSMAFMPKYCAFNILWHENPDYPKKIESWIKHPKVQGRILTKKGQPNFEGNHSKYYKEFLKDLKLD